ncbi:iron chaperone [Jiulongibacter sp. NS-SX5]|uniref:iron chaperone n=1 Tax=Jiulongibacter sp. NS-SX5 TaxID=3463854 RepID=UPI0040586406
MKSEKPKNVEEYIASFPKETQEFLHQMRTLIKENAPEAEESISYGMPAYKLKKKPLVYFGAYPKHIGFYATPTGHSAFAEEFASYKTGKGSVQFPLSEPLPSDLIKRVVVFRVKENLAK